MKSNTVSMSFFTLTLKSVLLSSTWMSLFTHHNFVTTQIGHLENIISLNYSNLWNIGTFYSTLYKQSCLLQAPFLSEYAFKYWEAVRLIVLNTSVWKFYFFVFKGSDFISDTNNVSCFPQNDRLTSFAFEKISDTQDRITTVYQAFYIPCKLMIQFATQTIAQVLFLKTTVELGWAADELYVGFSSYHTEN